MAILLFGIAFGYVEAAVVIYLRPTFEAARARVRSRHSSDDLFPLLSLEQVKAAGPDLGNTVRTEVAREAATLVMLGAVSAAVSSTLPQWLAFSFLAFGAWDLAYYAFLKALIHWPETLLSWDILFLIPVPWTGPVLAPVLVSLTMIGSALLYLWRDSCGLTMRLEVKHWIAAVAGALLILAAFVWDYRNIMAGGMPEPFNWPLFVFGETLWLAAVLQPLGASKR